VKKPKEEPRPGTKAGMEWRLAKDLLALAAGGWAEQDVRDLVAAGGYWGPETFGMGNSTSFNAIVGRGPGDARRGAALLLGKPERWTPRERLLLDAAGFAEAEMREFRAWKERKAVGKAAVARARKALREAK